MFPPSVSKIETIGLFSIFETLSLATGQLKRHFGSDQSVWRDGDRNGFVRVAKKVRPSLPLRCKFLIGGFGLL